MSRDDRLYWYDHSQKQITSSALKRARKQIKLQVMREWFFKHFSHPDILPYESGEGGYQWIWGGPHDASDELDNEFGGVVPEGTIKELASELEDISYEWSSNPDLYPPDDYLYESASPTSSAYDTLEMALFDLERLVNKENYAELSELIFRLAMASAIAAMEAYLADFFIGRLKNDPGVMKKFIETTDEFRSKRIPLSSIYSEVEAIEKTVGTYLGKISWHNLNLVRRLYTATLSIEFPEDLKELQKSIELRHDVVHRNGKSPDGELRSWSKEEVHRVFLQVRSLAKEIDGHDERISHLTKPGDEEDSPF